ncbi:DUF2207 domain-containing protein, partial [Candidatus Saccharibacteria bacterium]|nr:DUF2207 domain-containing protein [Candidatus Saccharibacteria bacterium]
YYLAKNQQNRSTLDVTEQLVAVFPNTDQNHGIERAIPKSYNGHPTNPNIQSVTNQLGNALPYTTYTDNDNLVLQIGDANRYVYGRTEYNIKYNLSDVTNNLPTGDEFYWDTNGTDWQQPFLKVTASLRLAQDITPNFTGQTACYIGAAGSSEANCTINTSTDNSGTIINTASNSQLAAGQNITLVAGFDKDTFAPYVSPPLTTTQKILIGLAIIVIPLWYIVMPIWLFFRSFLRWKRNGRNSNAITSTVPQYTPPKGVSAVESDIIINTKMSNKAIAATIVDLAVRHYCKIYERDDKEYELELTKDPGDLLPTEIAVIDMLFGKSKKIGNVTNLSTKSNLYEQSKKIGKDAYDLTIVNGYLTDTRQIQKSMNTIAIIILILSILTFNFFGIIAALASIAFAKNMPALSNKGAELKTYIEGIKMYMQVAEAERMNIMQSTKTAIKDSTQLVHLYEKLLPYAMLYGIEKSWVKQFADLYKDTSPDWYNGNSGVFNPLAFSGAVYAFGNTTTSSFSPPASSSTSGFSGGYSGGGGGGGGGGGW